ncbi:MFS transporter [Streptomyces acidiscabies]|uniref:MFS transporter n=1 Tax=Streptomyces acidiscabies TaxID=42234 RepID=UPI0038F73F89
MRAGKFAGPAHQDFRRLWAGQTISQLGSQITPVVLPLLAIGELHADNSGVAGLVTAQFLPFLLLGLPAGVWVDRLARRTVLIVCDIGRALVLATVPVAFLLDAVSLPLLYAVACLHGALTVFFDVAYQTYLPEIVERDRLADANGKLELSRSGAQIAGPGLAGLLVSWLRAPLVLVVDVVSYLLSAFFLWRIETRPAAPPPAPAERRLFKEVATALRWIFRHRTLAPLVACLALLNFFSGGIMYALLIPYAVRELGMSAGTAGLLLGLSNAGFVAGALVAGRIGKRFGVKRTLIGAVAANVSGMALLPLAPDTQPQAVFLAGMTIAWFGAVVFNIHQVTLRQTITPQELLGRVNASIRFVIWGVIPLGATTGGFLAARTGLHTTFWIAAVGGSLGLVVLVVAALTGRPFSPDAGAGSAPDTGSAAEAGPTSDPDERHIPA